MPISEQEVEKIAALANLELTGEEKRAFTIQLSSIVTYMDKLNELDTSDVEPMSHCGASAEEPDYAMRDDEVRPSIGQERALSNAPDPEAGFFKVPKVVERD